MIPKTFLIGVTQPLLDQVKAYLEYTEQHEFMREFVEYFTDDHSDEFIDRVSGHYVGGGDPLCLVSFYAKLCYKSLVTGKNANVTKIREIEENLKGVISSGHGSVFEHVWLNFVTTDCSRIFTHELVRHRVGTAFSQTSGRYVAIDKIDLVLPPEFDVQVPCILCDGDGFRFKNAQREPCGHCGGDGRMPASFYMEQGANHLATICDMLRREMITDDMPFADKKRITSAIRRLAPNGQTNEIGWSVNVRSLRHLIELRTSPHAEWEIREVFWEVARMIHDRWPMMLHGGVWDLDQKTVTGLRI